MQEKTTLTGQNAISVHAGTSQVNPAQGVNTPVYPSAAFGYLDTRENVYPRYYNTPNQQVVVEKLCQLEHAEAGLLTSSGMSAISTALMGLLKQGDHVLFQQDLYGGTFYFIEQEFPRMGIAYDFVDIHNPETMGQYLQPNTRLLYLETPSNPLLQITDIRLMVEWAKSHQLLTLIDNTFASPICQNPIDLGVDVVMHSGTKYLGGHSDLIFGVILTSHALMAPIRKVAVNLGGNINAQTCALIERSLKTLALRVRRQSENAGYIAAALHGHPLVRAVYYPGLPSHPGHAIAKVQMHHFGGMLSFEPNVEGYPAIERMMRKLQLIIPALSLGGVETLVCSPAKTSHIKLTPEARKQMGVSDELVRMSVGIEEPELLVEDILQALSE